MAEPKQPCDCCGKSTPNGLQNVRRQKQDKGKEKIYAVWCDGCLKKRWEDVYFIASPHWGKHHRLDVDTELPPSEFYEFMGADSLQETEEN